MDLQNSFKKIQLNHKLFILTKHFIAKNSQATLIKIKQPQLTHLTTNKLLLPIRALWLYKTVEKNSFQIIFKIKSEIHVIIVSYSTMTVPPRPRKCP